MAKVTEYTGRETGTDRVSGQCIDCFGPIGDVQGRWFPCSNTHKSGIVCASCVRKYR